MTDSPTNTTRPKLRIGSRGSQLDRLIDSISGHIFSISNES
jgi:hypothetical protein